jgi:hypothetical protein
VSAPTPYLVLEYVAQRIAAIRVSKGYSQDVDARRVKFGWSWDAGRHMEFPAFEVFRGERRKEQSGSRMNNIMEVGVRILTRCHDDAYAEKERAVEDVTRAVTKRVDAGCIVNQIRHTRDAMDDGLESANDSYNESLVIFEAEWTTER